jgi:hypothetical protein
MADDRDFPPTECEFANALNGLVARSAPDVKVLQTEDLLLLEFENSQDNSLNETQTSKQFQIGRVTVRFGSDLPACVSHEIHFLPMLLQFSESRRDANRLAHLMQVV